MYLLKTEEWCGGVLKEATVELSTNINTIKPDDTLCKERLLCV